MQAKKHKKMSDLQVAQAAALFGTLAEGSRLRLLQSLMEGPRTVTALVEATGLKQANVSKHLAVLHQARLVKRGKSGTCVLYELGDPFVMQLCELVCQRIARTAAAQMEELAGLA